ncbi:MAG: hypothetical protein FWE50_02230 [Alphaproteobacteria bacterium]|nr:hypothetical protein [Alphaproteobacteria bacterium]
MIKNIFWDADGVLTNLDAAYFAFLTKHPKYAPEHANMEFSDLPKVMGINPELGSLEMSEFSKEASNDFVHSEFFSEKWRPLYDGAREVIAELGRSGFNQTLASGTHLPDEKRRVLEYYFGGLPIEIHVVEHEVFPDGKIRTDKEKMMREFMASHGWQLSETAMIDDRFNNLRGAIKLGIQPIRVKKGFSTDLPADMKFVPEFNNYEELLKYLTEQK